MIAVDILKLNNVGKGYSKKSVLSGINLSVGESEIFGLIGLNGVGKTTLIKIILDLIKADYGESYICGKNTKDYRSRENIFYLPEKFQPSQNLKVIEFIKIFVESKHFALKKIEELCELLDLDQSSLNRKISSLSKGMSQKIGLISSVLENKKLIILDEPMTGLDPKARINLKNLLLRYKNNGKSVFFSSHILSDIDEICDRVAILNNGKIQFIGTPNEFKKKHLTDTLEMAFLEEISLMK
jgi:ABC-2 type transport system ATP-binding protein